MFLDKDFAEVGLQRSYSSKARITFDLRHIAPHTVLEERTRSYVQELLGAPPVAITLDTWPHAAGHGQRRP